jgi:hypothetical protein
MTVLADLGVVFDERALRSVHEPGLGRPAVRRRLEAQALISPIASYELFPIEALAHSRVRLAGGTTIGGGAVVSVIAGAEQLVVALCTIGHALELRAREHRAAGRYFEMLILDDLGSWAVDELRRKVYERVQAQAAERGWRLSSPLAPGESDWSIRDQRTIFRLLAREEVGISLSSRFVMSPLKSHSLVFGAGPSPMGAEGLTTCEVCSIQDRCRFAATRLARAS